MKEINEILLRRKSMVLLEENPDMDAKQTTNTEKALVISAIKNFEALGFTVSKELFDVMLSYERKDFEDIYKDLMPKLKSLVGADVVYNPMYPNFPNQVMEASDAELFINAIIHYFTFGQWMPEYEKEERLPLFDVNKMTVLTVGTKDDLMAVFSNLVASKTSLSAQDKADVTEIIKTIPDYMNYMPDEVPLKENVALIGKLVIEESPIKKASIISDYFKTATDVLRLIVALSDGDISLATKTKYRKLKRPERRMIMDLLVDCGNIIEDMFRYQYEWIRIGEIIHPGEYKESKYDAVNKAFKLLRTNDKPLMFGGMVHAAITSGKMKDVATLLKDRPGEFARQLDKVLRDATDKNYVVNCFKTVANDVSTTVLLQVRQHFMTRNNGDKLRVFFPKGNVAKAIIVENNLPAIEEKYCKSIVKICENALAENYKSKDFLGNVFIDEELKNYIVPFSQRSANSAAKIVVRGSKLPIKEDATAIRGFVWWTNIHSASDSWDSRVDIDLSAAFFDDDWNYVSHVSYTNLRLRDMKVCHSGDITDGGSPNGKGVAEFLDIDIEMVAQKARYVVYQIYSYTGQSFTNMPNCRFGFMEREDVGSGEIFEPTTVSMKMDITSQGKVAIPVIFDCKERKMIWCDMNISIESMRRNYGGINLESNLGGVKDVCKAIVNMNKPNVYDLALLNAQARGILVTDRNQADIIFSNDSTVPIEVLEVEDEETKEKKQVQREKTEIPIIGAFDMDYFMGQLL
jgi:stress response protein SCP2